AAGCVAEKDPREQLRERPLELERHDVEAAERGAQMIEETLGARCRQRVDRDQPVVAEDETLCPLGLEQRFRQQLVADLQLQPPLLPAARLLLGARAVFLETRFERVLDRRSRQQPRLAAQAQQVRTRYAAHEA